MLKKIFKIIGFILLSGASLLLLFAFFYSFPPSVWTLLVQRGETFEEVSLFSIESNEDFSFYSKVCLPSEETQMVFRTQEDVTAFLESLKKCKHWRDTFGVFRFYPQTELQKIYSDKMNLNLLAGQEIDFKNRIVLANYLTGGCGSKIYKRVYIDQQLKQLTYKVSKSERFCMSGPANGGINFIAVEHAPPDYKIVFERDI